MKLIDSSNIQFAENNDLKLHNQDEIILNIRKYARFASPYEIVSALAGIILSLVFLYIFGKSLLRVFFDSSIEFTLFNLIVNLSILTIFLYMLYTSIKGLYIYLNWFPKNRDKTIINIISKYGQITYGTITNISDEELTYEFETNGHFSKEKRTNSFITDQVKEFQVGDQVYVVYVYHIVSFLL